MPKRFTATEKWSKEWFQKLSPVHKCLWNYLCDNCDQAGVWEPNFGLASYQIGAEITADTLAEFGNRLELLESGKYWIVSFVEFQCGKLSEKCRAHDPIVRLLQKHGILNRVLIGYPIPFTPLQEKEEEKEQEEEKETLVLEEGSGEKPDQPSVHDVAAAWNSFDSLPKVQKVSAERKRSANARLRDLFFIQNYAQAIQRIAASNFCLGGGPHGWKATFDWLLQPDTVVKVMEGKYDNRTAQKHAHQRPEPTLKVKRA